MLRRSIIFKNSKFEWDLTEKLNSHCKMYIVYNLQSTMYIVLSDMIDIELTKITTMLLKASRYIIFLVFFQVSSINTLILYFYL